MNSNVERLLSGVDFDEMRDSNHCKGALDSGEYTCGSARSFTDR